MFTTGLGIVATSAFAFLTMLISIPTGVKIFNWIGTLWGGRISFSVPMLYALGFIWMFMMGGFTGIMHSSPPVDAQQQDSYFVIAHFHYVLIGGSIFALLCGIYFWFPKVTGKLMDEAAGKIFFYTIFFGFNLAFFPMHILGMTGMPRRTHTYKAEMGWAEPNFWSTIGALILGVGIAAVVLQVIYSCFKGKPSGDNPWDARTLEWDTSSPPKEYNFGYTPVIKARDQVWENNHGTDLKKMDKIAPDSHGIHMPDQSWWPLVVSIGLFIAGLGVVFHHQTWGALIPFIGGESVISLLHITMPGLILTFFGIYMWALEGPGGYHLHPDPEELKNAIDPKESGHWE